MISQCTFTLQTIQSSYTTEKWLHISVFVFHIFRILFWQVQVFNCFFGLTKLLLSSRFSTMVETNIPLQPWINGLTLKDCCFDFLSCTISEIYFSNCLPPIVYYCPGHSNPRMQLGSNDFLVKTCVDRT